MVTLRLKQSEKFGSDAPEVGTLQLGAVPAQGDTLLMQDNKAYRVWGIVWKEATPDDVDVFVTEIDAVKMNLL